MAFEFAPLLERYAVFQSRDAEEAREFLHSKEFRLDIDRRGIDDFDARINGVYMPTMFLGYVQYGPAVRLRAVHRDDYWIQLPTRGCIEISGHHRTVSCDRTRAAIASPTAEDYYTIRSATGSAGLRLCLFRDALLGQLDALLGEPGHRDLEFAPELNLAEGHGLTLSRFLATAVADLDSGGSMLRNPLALSAFEQFILTAILLSHEHNYSAAIGRGSHQIAPRDIRRVLDYVEANLGAALTLSELVRIAGVPGRTLLRHFRHFKGVSPMAYLRNARLDRVREALLGADGDAGVTDIAMQWGFSHMGRFAAEYRRRFGESPSVTIRRSRH